MADNLYEVEMENGRRHTVRTPHHHDDHPAKKFEDHLLDVVKGAAGSAAGNLVVRYAFKGKVPR